MDQSEFILAMTAILMGGGIVVTVITTVSRHLMRRRDDTGLGGGAMSQLDARLGRMEQAIDSMAIEVERISEGQRFTSKLLAERGDRPADRPMDQLGR